MHGANPVPTAPTSWLYLHEKSDPDPESDFAQRKNISQRGCTRIKYLGTARRPRSLRARKDNPGSTLQGMYPYRASYLCEPIRHVRICLISTGTNLTDV
jgi:hypothetical protein